MKYAIYARKSSEDDDRQALSIPAQIHEVKELVKKYGEEPPNEQDIFYEEKSARKPHRRDEFNRLVELIKEGVYDTIFCWNINRLSRNPLEGGIIQQLIVERKLRNIITPSDVVDSESCNEIIMGFLFGYSSQTSREISQNTRRGIREKIRNGGWPTSAPQFYENVGRKGKCTIVPHPDQAPYFEKWIDEIIKNRLNMRQAMRLINKWGVKTKRGNKFTPSTVEHALKNPIYCGILRYGEYEETEGNWEPLITKQKWYKLQDVLEDKAKPVTRTHMHKYNLMIKCSECGLSYTGYTITKKTGKKYAYYMCSDKLGNCKNLQLSEKQIEKQFSQAIAKVKLDEEKWEKLKKLVIQKLEKEFNFESQVRNDVDKQIDEINRKLDELLEMKLDGLVEEEDYKRKYKKLKKEIPELKAKRTDVEITKDELRNEVELFFDKIQTLKDVFANGDYHEKRNMLFEMLEAIRIKDKILDLNFKEPYKSVVSVGLGEKNATWGHLLDSLLNLNIDFNFNISNVNSLLSVTSI